MSRGAELTVVVDWIIRGIVSLFVAFGGIVFKRTMDQLDTINDTLSHRGIRLAVVETNQVEIGKRLDRFESKLDRILEKLKER